MPILHFNSRFWFILFSFLIFMTSANAEWHQWQWSNPLPQGNTLRDAAAGSPTLDQVVAVGVGGVILHRTDDNDWEELVTDVDQTLTRIIWTGTQYVAVGEAGTIITSGDGISWVKQETDIDVDLNGLVFANNMIVAVGNGGALLTSNDDGITWSSQVLDEGNRSLTGVTWDSNAQFVAVGLSGLFAYSADGITWQAGELSGLAPSMLDVTWGSSEYVAVGLEGQIMSSSDGLTWSEVVSDATEDYDLTSVHWTGDMYISVGGFGGIFTSTDGANWEIQVSGVSERIYGITSLSDSLVAVGRFGIIRSSVDGSSWATQTKGPRVTLEGVAWSGSRYVAVGHSGVVLTSEQAQDWVEQTNESGSDLYAVIWAEDHFIAVGAAGTIVSSVDAVSWSSQSPGLIRDLQDIAWSGDKFVVVGVLGSILSSDDAKIWEQRFSNNTLNEQLNAVIWLQNKFLAVGESGVVLTSDDGTAWSQPQTNVSILLQDQEDLLDVAWSGELMVAVGSLGSIITSTDGITWEIQQSTLQEPLNAITWHNNQFLIVTWSGDMITSPDGIDWTIEKTLTNTFLKDVIGSDNQQVVVGFGGTILRQALSDTLNVAPTVNVGEDQDVEQGVTVDLKAAASDPDGNIVSYAWKQTTGPDVVLSETDKADAAFEAPTIQQETSFTFRVRVIDDKGAMAEDSITVIVTPSQGNGSQNNSPKADAGSDYSVNALTEAFLVGNGTDSDGTITSYLWTQTGGESVTIKSADNATASFVAPDVTESTILKFQLVVVDNEGANASHEVSITINLFDPQAIENNKPVANAGDDKTINSEAEVILTGTGTDDDGSIASYLWEQLGGPVVSLSDQSVAEARFIAPTVVQQTLLTFRLTVTDDDDETAIDEVAISVGPLEVTPIDNPEPTANEDSGGSGGGGATHLGLLLMIFSLLCLARLRVLGVLIGKSYQ